SSVAQAGAMAALQDEPHTRKVVENNTREADRMLHALSELHYPIASTWANFIYCELDEDASAFAKRMRAENVIIRPLGPWGAPTAIRVTIGTTEQNDGFLAAFRKVAGEL